MTIAERLKNARRLLGTNGRDLSQSGLAARLGVSPDSIGKWERGQYQPLGVVREWVERELAIIEAATKALIAGEGL